MSRPDFELYPDEEMPVVELLTRLGNQFDFAEGKYGPDEPDRRTFEAAVQSEFGKLGLLVRVHWEQLYRPDGTDFPGYRPNVEPYGRVKKESETDHDRYKWGVTRGKGLDGQEGFVREDGSWREDPRTKLILPN